MKSKDNNLINYRNRYLKHQPFLTSFTPYPLFIFETYIRPTLHDEIF